MAKYKKVAEYLINDFKAISVAVDTFYYDEEDNTHSRLNRNRCAFTPGQFDELANYLNNAGVNADELLEIAKTVWTEEVISHYKNLIELTNDVSE